MAPSPGIAAEITDWAVILCPHCGAPCEGSAQTVCEVCGQELQDEAQAAVGRTVHWELVLEVDAQLYGTLDPEAPGDQPARTFTLTEKESLIGREGAEFHLQVPIGDPGVSRRHALLIQQPDGKLLLRDLNSANGTLLNGQEVVPGTDIPLRDGDSIALGAWTRIEVRVVAS
jgi:hypothetical protein